MKQRAAAVTALLAFTFTPWSTTPVGAASDTPQAERQPGDLEEVQVLKDPGLASVTSIVISPDGRYAYAAAFNSDTVTTFERSQDTGELKLVDTITNEDLNCAVAFRLSRDGSLGVASSFQSNTATLFQRDPVSGRLKLLDAAKLGVTSTAGLNFVIDAHFSPDNKFLYTAASDGVGVFQLKDAKLTFVELQDAGGRLKGLRDVRLSQNGLTIYAVGAGSNNVVVFDRDEMSGKLTVRQIVSDGEEGITALGGAFRAVPSADGKHLYVSSGRFGGDNAVSLFSISPDGNLKMEEELHNGGDTLEQFEGGNDIGISPDGNFVFALATGSDRLARFQRETESGKLISIGSQPVGEKAQPGCAGLSFSPDGKFVYVADEDSSSVVVYRMP